MSEFVLRLSCPEQRGIVHAVSGLLLRHGGNIAEATQYGDEIAQWFVQRIRFSLPDDADSDVLTAGFDAIASGFDADEWSIVPVERKPRVLVLVSKAGHCLNDLLFRAEAGDLPVEIVAVASNHEALRPMAESSGVPFHHLPVTPDTKREQERQILALRDECRADLVVLARYMQILSDHLARELEGSCINIHHSFLPSFKGAKPYHQAWERGVKLVGATAHYVNSQLDEGPIISQHVIPVDHSFTPADLVRRGRDAEQAALAEAVRMHAEGRVFLRGIRTAVLS